MNDRNKYRLCLQYKLNSNSTAKPYIETGQYMEYDLNLQEYDAVKEFVDAKIDELKKGLAKYQVAQDWDEIPI